MPRWEFPGSEPIDADVELTSGKITITAGPTELITVDAKSSRSSGPDEDDFDQLQVTFANGRLEITEPPLHGWPRHSGSLDVAITLPAGSRSRVKATSADLVCTGELGSLDVKTVSGEVRAAAISGDLKINTSSGRVRVKDVARTVTVKSASGAIELGRVGDVSISTASGRVEIAVAEGAASVRTASGRVRIDSLTRGQAEIRTVSGDIAVGIAPGIGVYLDLSSLSGQVSSELEPSDTDNQADLELRCRSVSGSLRIGRVALTDVKG